MMSLKISHLKNLCQSFEMNDNGGDPVTSITRENTLYTKPALPHVSTIWPDARLELPESYY
jgi:hypothetical protein